jgi:nucleoside-diphosphate kinase
MTEQVLVLIKPDGLKKSLTGNIISRLSEAKLKIIGAKVVCVSRELAEKHYGHVKDKPFFEETVAYLQGKFHQTPRVLALVYEGEQAIKKVRKLAGETNPEKADPTTIRGAFGRILTNGTYENVLHASSSRKDAKREIQLWFHPEEITNPLYRTKKIKTKNQNNLIWA